MRRSRAMIAGLLISASVVVLAALFASGDPDGLERVGDETGFGQRGIPNPFDILPDYTVPGLDGAGSTAVAGLIGVVVVFALVMIVGRLLARRRPER
jgi:cobalt/nickel transport system permease protein